MMPRTTKFVYWQEDDMWLGYLQEYPDYWTQGASLEELRENLLNIYNDITAGHMASVRKVEKHPTHHETAFLLPVDDPILRLIGSVSHGYLAQNIDDELYG